MAENEWVTGITAPIISRGIALLITGRGPPGRCTYIYIYYVYICIFFFKFDIPRKTNMSLQKCSWKTSLSFLSKMVPFSGDMWVFGRGSSIWSLFGLWTSYGVHKANHFSSVNHRENAGTLRMPTPKLLAKRGIAKKTLGYIQSCIFGGTPSFVPSASLFRVSWNSRLASHRKELPRLYPDMGIPMLHYPRLITWAMEKVRPDTFHESSWLFNDGILISWFFFIIPT